MKKKSLLILSIFTIILFGYLTITTAELKGASDGDDNYGFPLTFFNRVNGCDPCPPDSDLTTFYFWPLIADLLFAATISLLAWAVLSKIITVIKNKQNEI
ncbi:MULTISPECIES: hypothetical protein [Niastella]|uniref:Uncharacterized protein n=1 Tax=Niastella soli TaxID=2821487 RepID=A0ABS3YX22_9BACT|nr:hypothetical protein [Niastella soli]MBO9202475.1 hypothetical protein [Niastella soli]